MTTVFVDTSALLPLLDRDSDDHQSITSKVARLARDHAKLVTSSYVMVEASALVKRRLGREAYRSLGDIAVRAMDIVWVDEIAHHAAWFRAAEAPRRGPSLVDEVSFIVMRARGIIHALALDHHFVEAGFKLVE